MSWPQKIYSFRVKNPQYPAFLSTCSAALSPLLLLLEDEPPVERCELRHGPGLRSTALEWWVDSYVAKESEWSPFQFWDRIQTLMNTAQSMQDELLNGQHWMFGLDTLLLAHWQGASHSTLQQGFDERVPIWLGALGEKLPPLRGLLWRYLNSRHLWALLMGRIGRGIPPSAVPREGNVLAVLEGPMAGGPLLRGGGSHSAAGGTIF